MKTDKSVDPIPEFKTIQEEAEFWDTHSFADYQDQMAPAKLKVTKPLANRLVLRIDAQTTEELEAKAREKGIGVSTLARMWLRERLQQGS